MKGQGLSPPTGRDRPQEGADGGAGRRKTRPIRMARPMNNMVQELMSVLLFLLGQGLIGGIIKGLNPLIKVSMRAKTPRNTGHLRKPQRSERVERSS